MHSLNIIGCALGRRAEDFGKDRWRTFSSPRFQFLLFPLGPLDNLCWPPLGHRGRIFN